jgi:hypothetical protein
VWLITNCKNGVSSWELHRAIGVTQKTAWFILQRIRLAMQDDSTDGKLGGDVEVDETFIGGKARNMSKFRSEKRGISKKTSMASKAAVMGLLERRPEKGKSKIRLQTLDNRKRNALIGEVCANVQKGATVNTDALKSYFGLADEGYVHNVIDHAEAYVRENGHTNGCENFLSLLKRALKGTYVAVEPFHLFRYLDEQQFRFNNRTSNDSERFSDFVKSVVHRRLTYKELIAALSAGTYGRDALQIPTRAS